MALRRDPVLGCRFVVRIVPIGRRGGKGQPTELDVAEVVLPTFRTGSGPDADAVGAELRLILRRGHTGDPYLFAWWREQETPKTAGTRQIEVVVLDEAGAPVTEWRFGGCRLASVSYSPLDANQSTILMETAEITVDKVEQLTAD